MYYNYTIKTDYDDAEIKGILNANNDSDAIKQLNYNYSRTEMHDGSDINITSLSRLFEGIKKSLNGLVEISRRTAYDWLPRIIMEGECNHDVYDTMAVDVSRDGCVVNVTNDSARDITLPDEKTASDVIDGMVNILNRFERNPVVMMSIVVLCIDAIEADVVSRHTSNAILENLHFMVMNRMNHITDRVHPEWRSDIQNDFCTSENDYDDDDNEEDDYNPDCPDCNGLTCENCGDELCEHYPDDIKKPKEETNGPGCGGYSCESCWDEICKACHANNNLNERSNSKSSNSPKSVRENLLIRENEKLSKKLKKLKKKNKKLNKKLNDLYGK